jgi:hypothetical protein
LRRTRRLVPRFTRGRRHLLHGSKSQRLFFQETNGMRAAQARRCNGFVPWELVMLPRPSFSAVWPAGTRDALPGTNSKKAKGDYRKALAVRQLAMNFCGIAGRDFDLLSQPAHALRFLGAKQVPLSGMPAHHLAGGSNLEALCRAAMRLQLHFGSRFSWHNNPRSKQK